MKIAKLNDIINWYDRLYKVKWINPGSKSIGMVSLDKNKCPHCKCELEYDIVDMIEASPLFQENAKPVNTISDEKSS